MLGSHMISGAKMKLNKLADCWSACALCITDASVVCGACMIRIDKRGARNEVFETLPEERLFDGTIKSRSR